MMNNIISIEHGYLKTFWNFNCINFLGIAPYCVIKMSVSIHSTFHVNKQLNK